MGFQCIPQIYGLVRGEPKAGAKHRANGLKICQEAGNERYSTSETLDRSRSHLNQYAGFQSGKACWEDMCERAEAYRIKGKTKDGKDFERSLPHNAVIAYGIIFKPPDDATIGWSEKEFNQFNKDSLEVMGEIEPRIFRKKNLRMMTKHRDEGHMREDGTYGEHFHDIGDCIDENGNYCGNLIDAKLCCRINELYPELMRERGWDIDNPDITDFKRMGKDKETGEYIDPEYRRQRLEKRKEKRNGRSVNKYIHDKAERLSRGVAEQNQKLSEIDAVKKDLDEQRENIEAELEDAKRKHDSLSVLVDETKSELYRLKDMPAYFRQFLAQYPKIKAGYDQFCEGLSAQNQNKYMNIQDVANSLKSGQVSKDFTSYNL